MFMSRVIGHRGVAAEAPENTLVGCRAAVDKGFTWLELDATLLGNKIPVLFHDRRLHRTTNKTGSLRSSSASLLVDADAGGWFADQFNGEKIPQLYDALIELDKLGVGVNIELKVNGCSRRRLVEEVLKDIKYSHFTTDRLVISSFSYSTIKMLSDVSNITIGCLFDRLPTNWQRKAVRVNAKTIHLNAKRVSKHQVAKVINAGYELYCYTVNSKERYDQLSEWGVSGVFTDYSCFIKESKLIPE